MKSGLFGYISKVSNGRNNNSPNNAPKQIDLTKFIVGSDSKVDEKLCTLQLPHTINLDIECNNDQKSEVNSACLIPPNRLAIAADDRVTIWNIEKGIQLYNYTPRDRVIPCGKRDKAGKVMSLCAEDGFLVVECAMSIDILNTQDWSLVAQAYNIITGYTHYCDIKFVYELKSGCYASSPKYPRLLIHGSREEKNQEDQIIVSDIQKIVSVFNRMEKYTAKSGGDHSTTQNCLFTKESIVNRWKVQHHSGVRRLQFLSKERLASTGCNSEFKIWNFKKGKLLGELFHNSVANDSCELHNGQLIVLYDDSTAKVWDLTSYQCIKTIDLGNALHLCQLKDGKLVTGHADKIMVWDVNSFRRISQITSDSIKKMLVLDDGKLLSVSRYGKVSLHTVASMKSLEMCNALDSLNQRPNINRLELNADVDSSVISHLIQLLRKNTSLESIDATACQLTQKNADELLNAISSNPLTSMRELALMPSLINSSFLKNREKILSDQVKLENLSSAILKDSNNANYYLRRAQVYFRLGGYQTEQDRLVWVKATTDWKKASQLNPGLITNSITQQWSEVANQVNTERQEAEKARLTELERIKEEKRVEQVHREQMIAEKHQEELRLTLENATALFNNATGLLNAEDYDGAISAFYQALDLNPARREIHYYLGQAWAGLKQYDNAIESFNERLKDYTTLPSIEREQLFYARAQSKEGSKNLAQAQTDYEKVLTINPQHPFASEKIQDIKRRLQEEEMKQQLQQINNVFQPFSMLPGRTFPNPNAGSSIQFTLTEEQRKQVELEKERRRKMAKP